MEEQNTIWRVLVLLSKFLLVGFVFSLPVVHAADLNTEITPDQKQQFDSILTPIVKIYNFLKYAASLIAVIALLFAGMKSS